MLLDLSYRNLVCATLFLFACGWRAEVLAQDTKLRLGPNLSTRSMRVSLVQLGNPAFGVTAPTPGTGYMTGLVAGLEAPIFRTLSLRAEFEGGYGWGNASDVITSDLLRNGQSVQGEVNRSFSVSQTIWNIALGGKLKILGPVSVDARMGLQMYSSVSATGNETIALADGSTFASDLSTSRPIRFLRLSDDYERIVGTISGGIEVEARLSDKTSIVTGARGRYSLASVANTYDWKPWDVGLTVQFAWTVSDKPAIINEDGLAVPAEKAVIYVRSVRSDTITTIAVGYTVRRDTVWSIQESETLDTIRGMDIDTVRRSIVQRVERILPAPPPFLSAILTAHVINAGIDSLVSLKVEIDVIADTTTSSTVSIKYGDAMVAHKVMLGKTNSKQFRLADLIPALAKQTYIKLEVSGETTDAIGKTVQFPAQEIVLKRKVVNESLQKD